MGFFIKKTWNNRIVEHPLRRQLTDVNTSTSQIVEVTRAEGEVYQDGDGFTETNMNNLETRVNNAFESVASTLTANDKMMQVSYDSEKQKYGITIDETFYPFGSGGAIKLGQFSANTSIDVSDLGAESVNEFLIAPISNASCSCATGYVMGNDVASAGSSYINGGLSYNTSTGVLTITVPRLSMSQSSSTGAGTNSRTAYGAANVSCAVYYVGEIQNRA